MASSSLNLLLCVTHTMAMLTFNKVFNNRTQPNLLVTCLPPPSGLLPAPPGMHIPLCPYSKGVRVTRPAHRAARSFPCVQALRARQCGCPRSPPRVKTGALGLSAGNLPPYSENQVEK